MDEALLSILNLHQETPAGSFHAPLSQFTTIKNKKTPIVEAIGVHI
jgi:hypothetical protein